jgi:hypothetical protein
MCCFWRWERNKDDLPDVVEGVAATFMAVGKGALNMGDVHSFIELVATVLGTPKVMQSGEPSRVLKPLHPVLWFTKKIIRKKPVSKLIIRFSRLHGLMFQDSKSAK